MSFFDSPSLNTVAGMSMGGDVLLEHGLQLRKMLTLFPQKPLTSYKGWSHMSLPTPWMLKWDSLVLVAIAGVSSGQWWPWHVQKALIYITSPQSLSLRISSAPYSLNFGWGVIGVSFRISVNSHFQLFHRVFYPLISLFMYLYIYYLYISFVYYMAYLQHLSVHVHSVSEYTSPWILCRMC